MTLFALCIGVPSAVYLLLSSDWAQDKLRATGERELSELLGTEVRIGYVKFRPFSRLKIQDVSVKDDYGEQALNIGELESRAEIMDLILRGRIIIDYAVIRDMDMRLYRPDSVSPLNIENIIGRLKTDKTGEKKVFDVRLNSVSLVDCSFSYDVRTAPTTPGRFNPSHISLSDIDVESFAPKISNDCYKVWLRSLSCREHSGLTVKSLSAEAFVSDSLVALSSMAVELPHSRLAFNDISASIDSLPAIAGIGRSIPVRVSLADGSHVYAADLAPFVPVLSDCPVDLSVQMDVSGTLGDLDISMLRAYDRVNNIEAEVTGTLRGLPELKRATASNLDFSILTAPSRIADVIPEAYGKLPAAIREGLDLAGHVSLNGTFSGGLAQGEVSTELVTDVGAVSVDAGFSRVGESGAYAVNCEARVESIDASRVIPGRDLDFLAGSVAANGTFANRSFTGSVTADVERVAFKGYTYRDIKAYAEIDRKDLNAAIESSDPNLSLNGECSRSLANGVSMISGSLALRALRPDSLGLFQKYPGHTLAADISLNGTGTSIDNFKGILEVTNLSFCNQAGEGLRIRNIGVDSDLTDDFSHVCIDSDFLRGCVQGRIQPSSLPRTLRDIAGLVFPALLPDAATLVAEATERRPLGNDFSFEFSVENAEDICRFFNLPASIIDSSSISGEISDDRDLAFINIDLPWLVASGNRIVENTAVALRLDGGSRDVMGYATTFFPTIKGPMTVVASITGSAGEFDTSIDWKIDRTEPINGTIDFSTSLLRDADGQLEVRAHFLPGKINFGDDVWRIHESTVSYAGRNIVVDDFTLTSGEQRLVVDGVAGYSSSDSLTVTMDNLHLLNIFETLGIYNALLSGNAFGTIKGTALLSHDRTIVSNDTHIEHVGYNYCEMGTGDGRMWFDNKRQSFCFNVDITGRDNSSSNIVGEIVPGSKELDLKFDANHVPLGFLKPFMAVFSSGIEGTGSGRAHLYGTFENIDMTGDLYADTMRIKIDFTNVWYSASDSIHIRPGRINLDNIRIYDPEGHSAMLNGYIGHKCFRNAVFDINITDASNFLSYDVPKSMSPDWYGRIYGDGSASVVGRPGLVNISANMQTAPHSVFSFELSDFEEVNEYSFITFRDKTPQVEIRDSIVISDPEPDRITEIRRQQAKAAMLARTDYRMDINIDIDNDCRVILVMDPVGGDKIDSSGDGHMRMTYSALDNDLKLFGRYTLDQGNYNFTLQDIIIKNFTIKQGSSILFNGNPYAGILDLEAYNTVNANLSDLDESFLTDKDLNRTNVPVRALMKVTGDMRQPDLSFDLEFPTLNSDVYRKVRSIVSTDEMMMKQVIYLLVLNRFFTPEYMSATRGNELFSVASSTITSQLSSMLGKLSDNWSIAPNLRSDKGDFSDIEVDVNLSSSLLNNRLLFNGNFGYRDKSLNTNQFVGDFDVEYLLSKSGTWRLKAYNRYNDQNYYLRTAQTTQGIGLVYRKDFDNWFGWIRRKKEADDPTDAAAAPDSIPVIEPADVR